jgi:hypothetical protein
MCGFELFRFLSSDHIVKVTVGCTWYLPSSHRIIIFKVHSIAIKTLSIDTQILIQVTQTWCLVVGGIPSKTESEYWI